MPTPTALPAAARTKPREPLKPLCLFFALHTHFYLFVFNKRTFSGNGCSNESYYTGNVVYSDMLIRFTFFNQLNPLEEDLLYIFNPLEMRDYTDGLLCGISSADLMPCAFRCLVTLNPQELDESLRQRLLFSKQKIRRWGKLNMLLIGNRSAENSAFL